MIENTALWSLFQQQKNIWLTISDYKKLQIESCFSGR